MKIQQNSPKLSWDSRSVTFSGLRKESKNNSVSRMRYFSNTLI